jgi:hypothetical protein
MSHAIRVAGIVGFILLALGCATTDYQAYEGKNNLYEGQGGTKVVVDGIDFWANGSPPRKYTIIGMVVSEVGGGWGDEAIIRSSVAGEVKKQGGDAAIQVNNNSSFTGMVNTAPGVLFAANIKSMKFAIIRYVNAP